MIDETRFQVNRLRKVHECAQLRWFTWGEIAHLLTRIAELEARIAELEALNAKLEAALKEAEEDRDMHALNAEADRGRVDGLEARIAELEDEAKQWQESCGRNYVRAEQADDRVNWFEQENDTLRKRIANLEAALGLIAAVDVDDESRRAWARLYDVVQVARNALEER